MLDNLRSQTSFEPDEEVPEITEQPKKIDHRPPRKPGKTLDQLTRMRAPQRFMIALMLLMAVCLLGTVLLVLAGKVTPPVF